ncbi:MAG: glycosyltransferase family 2 protein [Acidimicrobiia bacterium]
MYRDRKIAAVVPAYNEEAHIADVIRGLPELVDIVVVVDDASTDRTAEVAAAVGDPRAVVVTHEENQGVGGAILTAHRRALDLGSDIDVVFAGDDQMDPSYLPALLDPIIDRGYGFTKANRFFSRSSFAGMPRYRVFGNIVLSFLTKLASGYWHLFDPQNGYTAITREALELVPFGEISKGYEFENDLLINLNIVGVRALDVSVPARYGTEVSGIQLRRVIPAIGWLLVRGFWKRLIWKYTIRSFSPIALFFFTGFALLLWGVGFGIWVVAETIGPGAATTGTVLLSVVPFLIGVQLLISALVLDIQESPD